MFSCSNCSIILSIKSMQKILPIFIGGVNCIGHFVLYLKYFTSISFTELASNLIPLILITLYCPFL